MRAVIQRVLHATVTIENKKTAEISNGLLVLLGIDKEDGTEDIAWLSNKIVHLRVFDDQDAVMNLSLIEAGGDILLVSQFTLHASIKKGNRPSYIRAAKPEFAIPIYEAVIGQMEKDLGRKLHTGKFGADMQVELINDGPVTIIIDTKNKE